MSWLQIVLEIVLVLVSAGVVAAVLLQPSKSGGLSSTMTGMTDTYFRQNKSRTREARLALATKVGTAVLVVISLTMVLVNRFTG